jgi:hypothetical protein
MLHSLILPKIVVVENQTEVPGSSMTGEIKTTIGLT